MDDFDIVRVLTRAETIKALGLSPDTWARMEARGETPPKLQLSARRIGYRVIDIQKMAGREELLPHYHPAKICGGRNA